MRIEENKKGNKKALLIIISLILVVLLASGVAYALFISKKSVQNGTFSKNSTATSPQQTPAQQKSNVINSDKTSSSSTPPTPQSSNIKLDASVDSSKNIIIETKLYNVSDGSCTLSAVSPTGATTKYSAPVIYQSEYSTCAGFTVSTNGKTGTWKISLTVTSNNVSASQETTVNVQ